MWTRHVGIPKRADELRRALEGCRDIKRQVSASYRVWWRWSDTGRVWWIELTFQNTGSRTFFTGLGGKAWVTDLVHAQIYGRDGRPRKDGMMTWGASSADYAEIPPGTSESIAGGGYTATGPEGRFEPRRVEVFSYVPGLDAWWCSLPVPERS